MREICILRFLEKENILDRVKYYKLPDDDKNRDLFDVAEEAMLQAGLEESHAPAPKPKMEQI